MSPTTDPASTSTSTNPSSKIQPIHPKVTITFCTQCKWMLRAAYHAQELLSTFSTSLSEVALRPGTGGIYTIDLEVEDRAQSGSGSGSGTGTGTGVGHEARGEVENGEHGEHGVRTRTVRLWDRKAEGGFPETKILKRLIRDVIDPERGLGHVDRGAAVAVGSGTGTGSGHATAAATEGSSADASGTTNGVVPIKKDVVVSETGPVLDNTSATHVQAGGMTGSAEQGGVVGAETKDVDDEDQCDCVRS